MWSQCPSRDWLNSERHIKSVRYCVVLQNDVAEVFLLLWKIANDSMKRKVKVKSLSSLQLLGLWPTRLPCPWNFPGKSTGVGGHFLLQGIFPT